MSNINHFNKIHTNKNRYNNNNNNDLRSPNKNQNAKRISEILQPIMRFKPRFEMERLLDTLNEYSYGKVDKTFLEKELKKFDKILIKKLNDANLGKVPENEVENYEEFRKFVNNTNKFSILRGIKNKNLDSIFKKNEKLMKNKQNSMKKSTNKDSSNKFKNKKKDFEDMDDNFGDQNFNKKKRFNRIINDYAKDVLSELHLKTHFQAALNVANNTKQDILNQKSNVNKNRISPIRAESEINNERESYNNKHASNLLFFNFFKFIFLRFN